MIKIFRQLCLSFNNDCMQYTDRVIVKKMLLYNFKKIAYFLYFSLSIVEKKENICYNAHR